MKNRYTITISGVEMNVISEESPEAVEALVGLVDRRMRDIAGNSKTCSKIEVALLCSLDLCSEKIKAQRKIKMLESRINLLEASLEEAEAENLELRSKLSPNAF